MCDNGLAYLREEAAWLCLIVMGPEFGDWAFGGVWMGR